MTQPTDSAQEPSRSSYRPWMGILTMVMILALLIGFWGYSENLIGTLERQAQRINSLEDRSGIYEEVLEILSSPNRAVRLIGSESMSDLVATVFVNESRDKAALRITDAPAQADDFIYLWVLADDAVVSGKVVWWAHGQKSWGIAAVDGLADRGRAAIILSRESSPSSVSPSGDILARGELR